MTYRARAEGRSASHRRLRFVYVNATWFTYDSLVITIGGEVFRGVTSISYEGRDESNPRWSPGPWQAIARSYIYKTAIRPRGRTPTEP